jgi:hypothetical protein
VSLQPSSLSRESSKRLPAEGKKYLEELILVEGGKRRAGFPIEAQDELMFLYQLLLDQHRILSLRGQKITANRPPGTKFTMGNKT